MSSEVAELVRKADAQPDGWRTMPLGSVIDFINGYAFKPEDWRDTGTPIIRIQNLNGSDAFNYFDGSIPQRYHVKAGDLLFCWSGSRGTSFGARKWTGPLGYLNQHIFRCEVAGDLDDAFAFFLLEGMTGAIEAEAHGGGGLVHIKKSEIVKFDALLPPLDEQRRIAEVLRSVDEAIAAAQDVVGQSKSNLEAATWALMSADGSAADWRHGRCDSFFVLQRGFDITEAQATPGPYRVISSSGPCYSHSEFAVEGPAVITGRKGRLGTVFYSDDACWPHDTALWVKDFKGNHPRFVYWKLRQMDLKAYDAATSVPTLNRNNVHALEIAFPPLAAQIDISEALDAMLLAIERAEVQLVALQAIKSSVSSDTLSGRVRVPA